MTELGGAAAQIRAGGDGYGGLCGGGTGEGRGRECEAKGGSRGG